MDEQAKRKFESWSYDGVSKKKKTDATKTIDVFMVLRVFKYKGETLGMATWNTFQYRDRINDCCGWPANTYVTLEQICGNNDGPPIINRDEAEKYTMSGDANSTDKESLAHCFLFSEEEKRELGWGDNQLPGFHLVSKEGLDEVGVDKWMRKDNRFLESATLDSLTAEMDSSLKGMQKLLETIEAETHRPDTPGQFFRKPARYNLKKQIREVPENLLTMFGRVLNCVDNYVSRPKDKVIIPGTCKRMETIKGVI